MHPGDAEHGVVDTVALEAAVTEDLPCLHAGEDVLDRSMEQLARSAGLVSLAHTAYHLMCLEAARTMPLVRLPATQWLDGLGGGPEGERLVNAALKVCAVTAGDDAQIILTTPQVLPASTAGLIVTEHESTRPLIPHARPESEEL